VGMRSFGRGKSAIGHACLTLNGSPYLPVGLLDQGYWPDGGLTAPSDEALVFDIELAKRMGFTMLRKHIKIEPLRWYYHCDRLGMLVWQDH
ncbi:glycoside hydrolase family 2, partial [Klebsiella pneumoniae]|nr:glycoside hydrolase family 2 [Klebsiella pneumoniae]